MGGTTVGSSRLRSGGEHCHRELKSGWEHCHRELAGGGGEGEGGERVADIKSNNPHLTGGE